MSVIQQEIRFAARSLLRTPLASSSIAAILALCIGAVAAVYSIVDVVLIRGLPLDRPQELIWVSSVSRDRPDRPFSLPELMDYTAQAKAVRVGGYASWSGILQTASGAQRLQGLRMSAEALQILGATPSVGRLLTRDDDAPGAPRVLLLGHGYWKRALAGDTAVVGRVLPINGERFTIVGVLPRFLALPVADVDAVVPLDPESDPRRHARASVNFLRMFARMSPGVSIASATRELDAIATHLREQFPSAYSSKIGVRVVTLQERLASTQRPALVVLSACVVLMVTVALANVLNVLLARAVGRQAEIAVRLALGASTTRVAVRLLIEGALLAGVAGVAGVAVARVVLTYAATRLALITPRIEEARLSISVLAVVLGICAIAVVLFSLVPILVARAVGPAAALRAGGRAGQTRSQSTLRSSFVVAELALAVVLASVTTAVTRSLVAVQRVELGYRPDSVFVARVSLPPARYTTPADVARFAAEMSRALASATDVVAAGATSIAPLSGLLSVVPFAATGRVPAARRDWPTANFRAVSSGYFAAIGAQRIAGRSIDDRDDASGQAAAVVNRVLAERYFARGGAVGREIVVDDNNVGARALSIVGVIEDVREVDLDGAVAPEIFISIKQVHPDGLSFVSANQFWAVRTRGEAAAFAPAFRRILHEVDASAATAGLSDLRAYVDDAIAPRRFTVSVLGGFTTIALLLAAFGVYSITAYTVEQRRAEIGLRMALGATPRGVVQLILGGTLRLAALGVALGLFGAFASAGFLSRLMFRVPVNSVAIAAAVGGALLVVAAAAAFVPGRRAARLDPLRALSVE